MEEHEKAGRIVAKTADVLVTVGARAKFIAEGARAAGMAEKNIRSFDIAEDAQIPVQNLITNGDLILVKASRAMHLEKIVEEIRQPLGMFADNPN